MAAYSELELKYAWPIANAMILRPDFRKWILSGTKHEHEFSEALPIDEFEAKRLRSPTIKNPYWFNYWCPKDKRCECRIGSGIETDILIILENSNERRLGIHVEVKRPGDKLGNGQAASYSRRAACWAVPSTRPRTVPVYQEFLTTLVCGAELAGATLQGFDKVLFHHDVAKRVEVYPEP